MLPDGLLLLFSLETLTWIVSQHIIASSSSEYLADDQTLVLDMATAADNLHVAPGHQIARIHASSICPVQWSIHQSHAAGIVAVAVIFVVLDAFTVAYASILISSIML